MCEVSTITTTNTTTEYPITYIDEDKIYLGRWCLNVAGYTVHKGNDTSSPSSYCSKKEHRFNEGTVKIFYSPQFSHGQDVRAVTKIPEDKISRIPETVILFNCDGHGAYSAGKNCAVEAPEFISKNFVKNTKHLFSRLFKRTDYERFIEKNELQKSVNKLFKEYDEYFLEKFKNSGGSTCTMKVFILDPILDYLHIYDITLGDSPSLNICLNSLKVEENNFSQNCDCKEGVQHWLNTSFKDSKDNLKPPKVVLGRFNTKPYGRIINVLNFMKDKSSNLKMIDVYDTKQNNDGSWNLEISETLKEFYKKCPETYKVKLLQQGGVQTLRDKEKFKKEYLGGGLPTYNFGNTIEGHGQNLGTFGDGNKKIKHRLHCVPLIKHSEIKDKPRKIYLIGSDGVCDVNTDKNLIDSFTNVEIKDGDSYIKSCCEKLFKNTLNKGRDAKWRTRNNFGVWDDQSAWIVDISCGYRLDKKVKIKKKNKFQKKKNKRRRRRLRKRFKKN